MPNAKCRSCHCAADAGSYCNSCAADIMAWALNPSMAAGARKRPGLGRPENRLRPCSYNAR